MSYWCLMQNITALLVLVPKKIPLKLHVYFKLWTQSAWTLWTLALLLLVLLHKILKLFPIYTVDIRYGCLSIRFAKRDNSLHGQRMLSFFLKVSVCQVNTNYLHTLNVDKYHPKWHYHGTFKGICSHLTQQCQENGLKLVRQWWNESATSKQKHVKIWSNFFQYEIILFLFINAHCIKYR